MDIREIRESSDDALAQRANEISEEIFRLRCVADRMTPQRGAEVKALRREFARVSMVQNERALLAQAAEANAALESGDCKKPRELRAWLRKSARGIKTIEAAKGN